nr:unnamed protein product [Spirometra erinaceieuropaei]
MITAAVRNLINLTGDLVATWIAGVHSTTARADPKVVTSKSNGNEMVQLPTDILREKLADVELPEGESDLLKDDSMLWRYLKARNGNIDEAQKMIRKSIEWRRTYKPHTIDCQWCHERPGLHSLVSPPCPLSNYSDNETNYPV